MTPELTDHQALAVLVVHELNVLTSDEDGCCADCCAPCGILRQLLDGGRIPGIIVQLPDDLAHLADSWTPPDEAEIRASWRCGNNPPCDTDDMPTKETP